MLYLRHRKPDIHQYSTYVLSLTGQPRAVRYGIWVEKKISSNPCRQVRNMGREKDQFNPRALRYGIWVEKKISSIPCR